MSLFNEPEGEPTAFAPLAARMRPKTLDEFAGQEQLLSENNPVRQAIVSGKLGSVILWGPAGCGKTTLAHIIADYAKAKIEIRSAVTVGVAEIRKIASEAKNRAESDQRTLLFLDEIHAFNRSQQDALLPFVESGLLTLIGATTENPFFVINTPLLSRARVLVLKPLEPDDMNKIISRALNDDERGLGDLKLSIDEDALQHLVHSANGDTRTALNALEASAQLALAGGVITLDIMEAMLQRQAVRYDRQGEFHYDTISAFIKSVRGSNPDAALHYMARMLSAGEDPRFIARRLMILASEDIGNADPMGLVVAVNAAAAVERIGMPEGRIILAQTVTYLACAPKSNASYMALESAMKDVESKPIPPVPMHLRNAPAKGMKNLGYGKGYLYPHDFPGGWVDQTYMPDDYPVEPYYQPKDIGHEKRFKERLDNQRKQKDS